MELGILASEPSRWFFLDFFDEVPRKKAEKRKIFFENILKRTSLPEDARHGRVGRGQPTAGRWVASVHAGSASGWWCQGAWIIPGGSAAL